VLQRTKTAAPATAENRTAAKAPTWVFIFKVAAPLKGAVVVVDEPEPAVVEEPEPGVVIVDPYVGVEVRGDVVTVDPEGVVVDPERVPVDVVEAVVVLVLAPMENVPVAA